MDSSLGLRLPNYSLLSAPLLCYFRSIYLRSFALAPCILLSSARSASVPFPSSTSNSTVSPVPTYEDTSWSFYTPLNVISINEAISISYFGTFTAPKVFPVMTFLSFQTSTTDITSDSQNWTKACWTKPVFCMLHVWYMVKILRTLRHHFLLW